MVATTTEGVETGTIADDGSTSIDTGPASDGAASPLDVARISCARDGAEASRAGEAPA
jgi:hypothetical protein